MRQARASLLWTLWREQFEWYWPPTAWETAVRRLQARPGRGPIQGLSMQPGKGS